MQPVFSTSDLLKLAEIVREETGNRIQEKNYAMIEARMRSYLVRLGLESLTDYWQHFEANELIERGNLQSIMTTHYTFFFREYAHFEILENWLKSEGARLKTRYLQERVPVKVWSAACSRGQEVYSLALFLEENLYKKLGVPFEVLGTDLDPESVAYAENGVYPIHEVNTIPHQYMQNYWVRGKNKISDYSRIKDCIRTKVKFQVGNLLRFDNNTTEKFDLIFCRNVFIYFSEENFRHTAFRLAERVKTGGLFVSGISEPVRFSGWNFDCVGPSCYRIAPVSIETPKPFAIQVDNKELLKIPVTLINEPKKYNVLCVDDSSIIQNLLKRIFSSDPNCGSVDVALNGLEAKAKLASGKYDLVTLDIHMPEMSGIEFLESAYDRKKHPPVLMISSINRIDLSLAEHSLTIGASDYVEKPDLNQLQKSSSEILTKALLIMRQCPGNSVRKVVA